MADAEEPTERTSLLRRRSKRSISVPHGDFSDKKRWWSIRVMYMTMFLSSVTFTLTISSIWPFLRVLDHSATTDFVGWVVAAYSLGQLVASPLFGLWANYRGRSREPLAASITLGIGANIMYAYLEDIPTHKGSFMIVARGLIGFAAGNVAVVRSYVAGATTLKERTPAMANVSIFQSVGFILGPVIQAAFVPLSYPGLVDRPGFHLNMYTAPAILGAILCFVNVVLLFTVFKEYRVPDEISVVNIQSSLEKSVVNYKPDYFAVIYCIIIFFVVLFIFTIFETIATPLSMDMFAWTKAQTTLNVGIMLAACGVEAIGVFIVLKKLSKRFNERYLLIAGFILCFIGYFVQIPWGDGKLVIAPAVDVAGRNITPTDLLVAVTERDLGSSQFDDLISTTAPELLSNHSNVSNDVTVITSLHNFTSASPVVNSTVVMSTTESFVDPVTMTAAEHITTDLTTASLETVTEETTTGSTPTVTEADILSAATIITPEFISTAETLTTTPTITEEVLSSASTIVTPDIISSAQTITKTVIPTTITDVIISTAKTLSSSTPRTTLSTQSSTTHFVTKTTEKILSTFSTFLNNETTTAYSNSTTTVEPVGCPATMSWCFYTPPVYLAQFIVGCVIISVGYPTANVMTYTLYSKILGPKPQGLWMGWLTASGSLARTLGPIFVTQIYYSFGPRLTFAVDCGIILLTIFAVMAVFKKLVPCKYTTDYSDQNGNPSN